MVAIVKFASHPVPPHSESALTFFFALDVIARKLGEPQESGEIAVNRAEVKCPLLLALSGHQRRL